MSPDRGTTLALAGSSTFAAALTISENEVGSVRETPPEEEKTVNNRLCEGGGIKRATMSVGH